MRLGSEAKSILTGKVAGTKGSQKDPSQNCQEERMQKICVGCTSVVQALGEEGVAIGDKPESTVPRMVRCKRGSI